MSLKLKVSPIPTSFESFLIHFGGMLLTDLFCVDKQLKGCGCKSFDIYQNSVSNVKFVIIHLHHVFKIL